MNIKLATRAEIAYKEFMVAMGIDVNSPHAKDTPHRVARFYREYTEGLRPKTFTFTAFPKNKHHRYDQLVVVGPIPFYTLCAHHHVPFYGQVHVGYLPHRKIIGLSKIVRVVQWLSRKPNIQEDFTEEIANELEIGLKPKAVLVYVDAEHLCISMRGVAKHDVRTKTHCLRGQGLQLKDEFLQMIRE